MNRSLRFRVWDAKEKKWTGLSCSLGDGYTDLNDKNHDLVITQFTGLIDSKWRDIYEGDIIQYRQYLYNLDYAPIRINVVTWSHCLAAFALDDRTISHVEGAGRDNFEIIGNIFENSDLLK